MYRTLSRTLAQVLPAVIAGGLLLVVLALVAAAVLYVSRQSNEEGASAPAAGRPARVGHVIEVTFEDVARDMTP